jgi:hypothetical protein
MSKHLTDPQYAVKAATRRAIQLAGGPHAAEDYIRANCPSRQGMDAARLSRYGNPNEPEFAPIDICFLLDQAAGSPEIVRALACLEAHDLVARESVAAQLAKDVTALAGDIAKDSGELISTAIEASGDGVVSINEAKAIDQRAADLQDKVVDIRRAARKSMVGK